MVCQCSNSCFSELNDEEKKLLFGSSNQIRYKPGETIIKQGNKIAHVLHVEEGYCKLLLEAGKNITVHLLKEHDHCGLINLYDGNTVNYSVTALTEVVVCLFDKEVFIQVLENNPAFMKRILQITNQFTSLMLQKLRFIGQKQLHGRIASTILYLADEVYQKDTFRMMLSRSDFAEFTATSKESLIRILSELRNDKIIDIDNRQVGILQRDLLERISRIG